MDKSINLLLEGPTDEPIVRRILDSVGLSVQAVYGLRGKAWIDANVSKYNKAAKHSRWLVLRDFDADAPCAPELVTRLLPEPEIGMRFRIAMREAEAWLLGDRKGCSRFLNVAASNLPLNPEGLDDPKETLVKLARRSRSRRIREGMVPEKGTSAKIGPEYGGLISEFATKSWDLDAASNSCDSLRRFRRAISNWAEDL